MSGADAARIQNMAQTNASRKMYTANPPVAIEVEEKNRQDVLRASAVAMAQKMFAIQQVQIDEARGIHRSESHYAAHTARRRAQSDAANNPKPVAEPHKYENLEESARRLAQERLSKIHDEHAEYRQYYVANSAPQRSRTFLRRGRRREEIPEDDDDSDVEESRKIRQQMSLFQGKLAEVDNKKRQTDRDALLAVAHKNVTARMNAMDEKVFSDTGKTSTQQRELWERQARERAQKESDTRLMNVGKVHIGGGKYLEQEEIDAIARARLQPTLDDLTRKAEEQRARDEELRLEQERVKAEQEAEKKRQAEIKAEQKAVTGKFLQKNCGVLLTFQDREKAEQKAQRTEEKRVQDEQRHEERRVRTEQKTVEKQTRDAAKAENAGTEPRRSWLPTFLGRSGVAAGAAAGAGVATVAEGTATAAEGVAAPGLSTGTEAEDGLVGETVHDKVTLDTGAGEVHDQVTMDTGEAVPDEAIKDTDEAVDDQLDMDPGEAAYAVAAADAEDDEAKPTEVPLPGVEEVGPTDDVAAPPYGSVVPTQDATIAALPMSPPAPTSPSKRNSRVKSFFKRLRTGSKAENDFVAGQPYTAESDAKEAVTAPPQSSEPAKEEDPAATDSMRDVAFAGRSDNETEDMYGGSAKPDGRVSPIQDEPQYGAPGPAVADGDTKERDVSPPSKASSVSDDPFVIAADVASSRYSTEHAAGSKRNSGHDQLAAAAVEKEEEEEEEPRGRKGFRERFLKKVIPGRDKDKRQAGTFTSSAVGSSAAAQTGTASAPSANKAVTEAAPATAPEAETETTDAVPEEESDLPSKKVQEPSTTSTEATGNTTVTGATTPALTHTQTNGDDDEDFEEARDTFDEGRLVSASKVDSGSARIVDVNSPMSPTTAKSRTSGEGSRFTEEL